MLSTSNHPESHYSHRSSDSSTFHSLNRFSIPSSSLSNELCSPKQHSNIQSPSEYTVAIVSSSTNHTPVSSDDGFCGSSDTSDPSIHHGNPLYRQPYIIMKEDIINKTRHSPSFGTDTTRRVRFNLQSERQRTMLPSQLSDHTLRQFEQMYMTRDNSLENSTIV
jgi:hypothetical protein